MWAQGRIMPSCSSRSFRTLALASTPSSFAPSSSTHSSRLFVCLPKPESSTFPLLGGSSYVRSSRRSRSRSRHDACLQKSQPWAMGQLGPNSDLRSSSQMLLCSDGILEELSSTSTEHSRFGKDSPLFVSRFRFPDSNNFSCLSTVSTHWNRRIASKCRVSKQQEHCMIWDLTSESWRHSDQKESRTARLQAFRSTFAGQEPSTPVKNRWTCSGKDEIGCRSSKNATLSSWRNPKFTDEFPTSRDVVAPKQAHPRAFPREGSKGLTEQQLKAAAFEQWANNKLKEDGPAALTVIEELRQTFAPTSPGLDTKNVVLGETLRNSRSVVNLQNNPPVTSKKVVNSAKVKPVRFETTTTQPTLGQGTPGWVGGKIHESVLSRSNATSESLSQKSFSITRGQYGRKCTSIGAELSRTKGTLEINNGNQSSTLDAQPLLVKRRTKFPVDFHGKDGTVMLVDKPQGWSSFAICAKLRYLLKIQKVGHAGTLDPMATGLLIVCLGKATKLADSYQAMTKVYSGTIRLGELTPSLDAFTEVSDVLPWEHITDSDLEIAKKDFLGDIFQTPPMYSAIKVDGERLYKKARRGEEIEVAPRIVSVSEFQLKRSSENRQNIHFRVTCSKGTYIRSLCSDLARAAGSYGHLTALRREKIGSYDVSDAWPILDFEKEYCQSGC